MAYTPPDTNFEPIGSGNPFYGSGFTNFDRYITQQGVDWGAGQEGESPDYTDYDNWMIQLGSQNRVPQTQGEDINQTRPVEPPPTVHHIQDTTDTQDEEPVSRLPSRKQDDIARYDPRNPDHYPEDSFPTLNRYMNRGY